MNRAKLFAASAMAAVAPAIAPRIAAACASCGLADGGHAYTMSAIFLLSGPYVTMSVIGGILYAAWRRSLKREKAAQAASILKQ
ncbi:MAG TPA: hypothetical protein VMT58_01635 [Candidatus Binataceae bacterium]|nr:hypothetical protein [Candidatus Binataceae bacterium]